MRHHFIYLLFLTLPMTVFGQDCLNIPDSLFVCGFSEILPEGDEPGSWTYLCDASTGVVDFDTLPGNQIEVFVSECGYYYFEYMGTAPDCMEKDTLEIYFDDPSSVYKNVDLGASLGYGTDGTCPGDNGDGCANGSTISMAGFLLPSLGWHLNNDANCQSTNYITDVSDVDAANCEAGDITVTIIEQSDSIALNDTILSEIYFIENYFTYYDSLAQALLDSLNCTLINLGCPSICVDTIDIENNPDWEPITYDTIEVIIPHRVGGNWFYGNLQLEDTTLLNFGATYQFTITPGADHYGPDSLHFNLQEQLITGSDTTYFTPDEGMVTFDIHWRDFFEYDTLTRINTYYHSPTVCLGCGGIAIDVSLPHDLNPVFDIPTFPCNDNNNFITLTWNFDDDPCVCDPADDTYEYLDLCFGEFLEWNGLFIEFGGTYETPIEVNGCPATAYLEVNEIDCCPPIWIDVAIANEISCANPCTEVYINISDPEWSGTLSISGPSGTTNIPPGGSFQVCSEGSYFVEYYLDIYPCVYATAFTVLGDFEEFSDQFSIELCEGECYDWNGIQYCNGGSYEQTFEAIQNGCDSTVTLNLNVIPVFTITEYHEVCPGETYNGYPPGFYMEQISLCEFIEIEVIEIDAQDTYEQVEICDGDTYSWNGLDIDQAGIYEISTYVNGCSVTAHLDVSETPITSLTEYYEVCPGDTYNGYPAGIHIEQISLCEFIEIEVVEIETQDSYETLEICPQECIDWQGMTICTPGIYEVTTTINGCPATAYLDLSGDFDLCVYPDAPIVDSSNDYCQYASASPLTATGENLTWYDNSGAILGSTAPVPSTNVAGSTSYFVTQTVGGLESPQAQIIIGVWPQATSAANLQACQGSTVEYAGNTLMPGDTEVFYFTTTNGCDSIVTVTVTETVSSTEEITEMVCPGEAFVHEGTAYYGGMSETFVYTNSQGCDSIVQVNIEELPAAQVSLVSNESCEDTATGSISIAPQSGSQPFVYALNSTNNYQENPEFTDLIAGNYELLIEDNEGCQFNIPAAVAAQERLEVTLSDMTIPCGNASIDILPEVISGDDGHLSFMWNDGSNSLAHTVSETGNYELTVFNGCEEIQVSASIEKETNESDDIFYIPTGFSPNYDGINDEFGLYPAKDIVIENIVFQVFDRWGNAVFESTSENGMWKGQNRGQSSQQGLYAWRVEATIRRCGVSSVVREMGSILLVR